jgi:Glycosyltransferase 61
MNELITKASRRLARDFASAKKTARKRFASAVYSCPGLTHRNPRHRVVRLADYCNRLQNYPRNGEKPAESWYLPLDPPRAVDRKEPVSLNETEAEKFRAAAACLQNGIHCQLPETFLACIHDAKIYGQDFLVLSPDNRIFFDSALLQQKVLERNGILETLIWPTPRAVREIGCLMAQETPNAYYHWLIEVMPKLSTLQRFEQLSEAPLIVPPVLKPFQTDSLKMAGVSDSQLVPFDNTCWEIRNLFFPSMLGPTGSPAPMAVAWLRKKFLRPDTQSSSGPKRIYLTRQDASRRKVLNERELIAFLEAEGFVTICTGELSFVQQIQLFSNVEVVVAAHGAGSTNMVFASENAVLIELFGDNYINGCFWALTNILGQRHAFLTGPSQWLDYSISLQELKALLAKVCC